MTTIVQARLDQAMKKILFLLLLQLVIANQQARSVKSVVIKPKAFILADSVVNLAKPFFAGPCRMIPTSHFFVFMVKLAK